MKYQILFAVVISLIASSLFAEDEKLTPDAFIESMQGTWEIVSRNNGGLEWTPNEGSRKPVMTVEKNTMLMPEGIGKLPYEMQNVVVDQKTDTVSFNLVAKLGQRTIRRPVRAKLADDQFTMVIHKYQEQLPKSLAPDKNSQIQVWKRQDKQGKN